jgi:hypothetical protein
MQNIEIKETKEEVTPTLQVVVEEKVLFKKTLSEREIEKSNSNKIVIHNLTNSTKNATNKLINFNLDFVKKSDSTNSHNNNLQSTVKKQLNEDKHINFKILNDLDKIPKNKEKFEIKVESKLIPKSKDLKIPFTQISLAKTKTDLKFPNSSRTTDNKVIFEPNLIGAGLNKVLLGSSKILKKVTKK